MDNKICFLEYNSQYYIIDKKYFNNNSFTPLSLNEIISIASTNINQDFLKETIKLDNGTVINTSDYIDLKKCKIRYMNISETPSTQDTLKINFSFIQSDKSLKNTEIKIKEKQENKLDNIIDFISNNQSYIDYSINSEDYKTALDVNNITEKEYYLKIRFNNPNANLKKIDFKSSQENNKFIKLKSNDINIFKDEDDKIYFIFKKSFKYKIYINYLKKEIVYINKRSLEVIE